MPDPVQVYEGWGLDLNPDTELKAWKMWRGSVGETGYVRETELCGHIPYVRLDETIPHPPDRYKDCENLYLTDDEGSHYKWDRNDDHWSPVDISGTYPGS